MDKIIKLGLAVFLFLCLFDMPYGYYQFVRFIGMIGFAYVGLSEKEKKNDYLSMFWFASAILINPLIKISLGRELWNIVDVVWGVMLLISVFNTSDRK